MKELILQSSELMHRTHRNKPKHTIDDFFELVNGDSLILRSALQSKALFPFQERVDIWNEALNKLRDKSKEGVRSLSTEKSLKPLGYNFHISMCDFKFYIPRSEHNTMVKAIEASIKTFDPLYKQFSQLRKKLDDDVGFEVLPSFGDGTIYTHGTMVVPLVDGYHAFEVETYNCAECDKTHLTMNQVSEYPVFDTQRAINLHTDENVLKTRIIVSGTSSLPVDETVIPILKQKYLDKVAQQR
jgi:hypothetical protein